MTVVGVDIGGTKIAAGIVDATGRLDQLARCRTPARSGGEAVLDAVAELVEGLRPPSAVTKVGVSTGGIVDPASGTILAATDLIVDWAGARVADGLASRLGVAVRVDNDGNAFALAEHRYGAARGHRDLLCVAVGTGIGGGVVLDGRLRHGPRRLTGEFGHLAADTDRRCSCGRPGHVEAVASGPAMTAIYNERAGADCADLRAVVARAESGDRQATKVIAAGATALGRAIGGLLTVLDVPTAVIGGGVADLGERYLEPLRAAARSTAPHGDLPTIRPGALGANAAVVGAVALWSTGSPDD